MSDLTDWIEFSVGRPRQKLPEMRIFYIRRGIETDKEFFDELYKSLQFPAYFGFNWNATFDCLKDMHWIKEFNILISHEDLPRIGDENLSIYIDILRDSVTHWRVVGTHELRVTFPLLFKADVERILNDL